MAKRYDPIMCMMVDKPDKAHDELSLSQKKQVVTELKGFLKKSYNFSDESEYARAYEDLRHMFTTGSRKSISGLFENTVKKTGAHDSASTLDKAIRICDASTGHKVIVFVENYLRSIGKNNSTGKYDKIVQGVRSLLSQSLLDDDGLKKAAEHEADRLLKKYNL